jgi:hypothetical protein
MAVTVTTSPSVACSDISRWLAPEAATSTGSVSPQKPNADAFTLYEPGGRRRE